jgi:tripartite-type tricarboxylate transporter receptor subunit TctC
VKTVSDLIAYAKPRSGKISYGAFDARHGQHLSAEMFKRQAGIDMTFIPYKGTGAMLPDILGGRLQVAVDNVLVLAPHVRTGALNALAGHHRQAHADPARGSAAGGVRVCRASIRAAGSACTAR